MTRAKRWTAGVLGALALALLAAGALVAWWLPSEAQLATRLQDEFAKRFDVPLKVGRVHWALSPVPVIVIDDIATGQEPPITVRRVALHPDLGALWDHHIALNSLEIDGAVLPRASVRAFRGRKAALSTPGNGGWSLAALPVAQVRFSDVTWIDRRAIALAYEGNIDFDAGWRPRVAEVSRVGVSPVARLRLHRQGDADRWLTLIDVGGGTWNGTARLQEKRPAEGGDAVLMLNAELAPDNVDIAQLVAAFDRKSAVHGKLFGRTEVEASGASPSDLARSLHTRTRFSVRPAALLGFDLAKAVSTAGLKRDGQTPLDELTGTLDTQSGDDGVQLRYSGLRARSGLLTATGNATVFNRKLDGEFAVDLVDGVVGVPFKLGGTLDKPLLSLTGGALAGAAVGSAVLPGVGTVIGARIGQKIEEIFGDKPKPKVKPKRSR
jgi:hypothetical protein